MGADERREWSQALMRLRIRRLLRSVLGPAALPVIMNISRSSLCAVSMSFVASAS